MRQQSGPSPVLLPLGHLCPSVTLSPLELPCARPFRSTTATPLGMSLKHKGSMSPEERTETPQVVAAPLLQRHLSTKAPEGSGPSIKGEGKGNVAFLSYSHSNLLQQELGPSPSGRPDRNNTPRDGGQGVMSPPWQNSAQSIVDPWLPSMGACGPGLPGLVLDPGMFSVCLERCLVAFQGLPVTEQGMIKAWLGEAVTLGVLRRNYLILNSSQNSNFSFICVQRRNARVS